VSTKLLTLPEYWSFLVRQNLTTCYCMAREKVLRMVMKKVLLRT